MSKQLSITSHAVVKAFEKGYRVTPDGVALGVHGKPLSVRDASGYLSFKVYVEGFKHKYVTIKAHRLAGYQKFGEAVFEKGVEIRHLDGNPGNNAADNLALGTHQQNMLDRNPKERRRHARKAAAHTRKLTQDQAEEMRSLRSQGVPYKELASLFGVSKSAAFYVCSGATYSQD